MDISYELYRVFYHVASTLSFSQASRQLFISQSAVSQSIKMLEQKLGQTLFIRSTKKVQLTPEGELLYRHIEPAVNLITQGEQQLLDSPGVEVPLRIGASDTICRYFLVPYLERFHREFPHTPIHVTNATSIGCVNLLESGQADLIVVNTPNTHLDEHSRTHTVHCFQDIFVANRNFFPLEDKTLSLQQILDYPILLLSKKSTTSAFLHQHFLNQGLQLNPEIELSSNDLLIDLARIGLGIAFVPDYMLSFPDKDLIPIQVQEAPPTRQLVLAYQENHISPAVQAFMAYFS